MDREEVEARRLAGARERRMRSRRWRAALVVIVGAIHSVRDDPPPPASYGN
jgi:hypothetical protein